MYELETMPGMLFFFYTFCILFEVKESVQAFWLTRPSVQTTTPCPTSRWWRWCRRMRHQRSRVWAVSSHLSQYQPCTNLHSGLGNVHLSPDIHQHMHVGCLSLHSVVNWLKQKVPQPVLVPPGAVIIEPSNKNSTRFSLDKGAKTRACLLFSLNLTNTNTIYI